MREMQSEQVAAVEDPVCGRVISLHDEVVLRRVSAAGQAFFLCSSDCAQRFRLMQQPDLLEAQTRPDA